MNAPAIRIVREARILCWPWCAVTFVGIVPWLQTNLVLPRLINSSDLFFACFAIGISLLASLSLGSEFQHGTISILLCQPAGRARVWAEKSIVTFAATTSAALAYAIGVREMVPIGWMGVWLETVAAVFLLAVSSATYWTLLTRSIIGAWILSFVSLSLFIMFVLAGPPSEVVRWALLQVTGSSEYLFSLERHTIFIAAVFYAGLMVWLGRRKLLHFQVRAGVTDDDLLTTGPHLLPAILSRSFHARRNQGFLNLIRKELRLLRPFWVLTLIALTVMIYLVWVTPRIRDARFDPIFPLLLCYSLLAPLLAGALPVGEERTIGTLSWHRTLPVTVKQEWLVKLASAVGSGVSVTVAFLVLGHFLGVFTEVRSLLPSLGDVATTLLLLTVVGFWCSCMVGGTVRATILALPVAGAIALARAGGIRLASTLAHTDFNNPGVDRLSILVLALIIVVQSYRLFREGPEHSTAAVARRLIFLVIVAFMVFGGSQLVHHS